MQNLPSAKADEGDHINGQRILWVAAKEVA